MMRRMEHSFRIRHLLMYGLFLCVLVVNGINAEATCKKGCTQSDTGILQYIPGNVYEYNFDSIMTVGLSTGASIDTDDTSLKIIGTAKIFAEGNCGYTLQLSALKVTATKESIEHKITQNIQKPVHFTMVNGKVEPEICADTGDTAYALNVKRAIISMLQSNKESEQQEVDVFGQCATHTSISKVGNAEVVTKVRDLNSCAYREQINSGFVNGVVNAKAGVKSTMLFQAHYSKDAKIDRGVVDNVQLVEDYKFVGASKGGPDVHAKVISNLKLKNMVGTPASAPASSASGVSIIFQKPETYTSKNIAALKVALSDLVQLIEEYVQVNSASHFMELIRLMRNADTDTLLELAAFPHQNKVLARKVYLDALFRTGTAESVKAIIKQMNKLEEKEKLVALLSFNLVQTVDKDTLTQSTTLLTPNASKEVYLAVGHIVSKYCQRHGCTQGEIETVSKKFTDALKHCKANTKKEEERIVNTLKGIGNTRHLASSVAATLSECTASGGRSNRIRVTALQAFSAASCEQALQTKAMELLKDRNEDAELRIEAYLAAINCPTAEMANEISELVNSETVNQVGGFIASNLRAIRDSTDATREYQRYYLSNIRVTKNFRRDFRRYSFNNEVSYKFDALGLSASSDYKLIYSQHGFLPRSARLNVSTEVFGTNFNVFEASVRQENIEDVLEYYIGPKGLLNKDFDEIMKSVEVGGGSAGGRARRSIADDTAKVAKKYKSYGSKNTQDINFDLSLKLFGSEMLFLSLGDNIPTSLDDILKVFSKGFEDIKKEVSAFNKQFNVHSLFLDTELMYPTGLGIPLEFAIQGFSANKLDLGLSVDVDAILEQNWQRAKYRFKVVPSVDVNVNVRLGFDAYVLSTGMRVVSNMHSATGGDINFAFINDGNGFNMDIELPREKIELINLEVKTDFFVAEQDKTMKSISLKNAKKRKGAENSEVCFNQLEAIGFSFCFTSSISDSSKAVTTSGKSHSLTDELYRPLSFSMYITSERRFNLKGYHVPQTTTGSQQWKLDFSTPASKVSHDTSLAFELGTKPRTYGRISFDNPQYHFGLEAGINNDNKELIIYAQYEQNDDVKKSKIGFMKNGNEYTPVIEIQDKNGVINDINGYRADGKVVVQKTGDKQARYNFENFQVMNKDNERVVINGWADVGPASLVSELYIAPGQQSYFIKSNFKLENGEYIAGIFVNDERTPDNVMGGSVQVKVGQQEYKVQLVGKGGSWEVASSNSVQYVKPKNSNLIQSSKFNSEIAVKNKNNLVGAFKLNGFTEGQNKFEIDTEIVRGNKVTSLIVKYAGNQRSQNDYSLEVNGKLNKHFINLVAKCDVNGNRFVLDNVVTTSWGTSLTAKGELGQRFTQQDIFIDMEGSAQFSGKEKPTQWLLKVTGSPEKTNAEFKLLRDNAELVKYNGETQHPQDKIIGGKSNLIIKNILTGKVDFKIAKNGKGEVTATVETQKTEPKHKFEVNSKFHIQTPKYDIETTVTLDAGKKVYFKTENIIDKIKHTLSTKNIAEVADKKITFDANASVKGDWRLNGEVQGNFVFTCPEGRVVDGSVKRKVTTNAKTGVAQGNMEINLNDQVPDGSKKQSIVATGKIEQLNVKAKEFSVNSQFVYTSFDQKTVDVTYHIKHLPKDQNNKYIDFGATVRGDFLNVPPIDLAFAVEEYSSKHAVYRVSGKYSDQAETNINGNYNIGDQGNPCTFEVQGNLQIPKSSFKTIEIKSNGKFMKANIDNGVPYMMEVHIDEKAGSDQFIKFNTVLKGSRQQGSYNLELETQKMQAPLKLDGLFEREQTGSIRERNARGKQKYAFNMNYAERFIKSTADMSFFGADTATLHYILDTSFESAKGIDIDVRAQKHEGESYAITMNAKQNGKSYTTDSKIFRSSHKKGLDVHISLPNGEPVVVVGIFELLGERKAKLTIQVEHLMELDLTAIAEASYKQVDDFYIVAQWSSAKLNLDDFDLNVRSQGKSININLKNGQGVIFGGSATYALKKEKNKAIIEGQGQLQYKGKSQNTNFRLIRQIYDITADNEVGFSYTFNGNFGPKNGVSTLKITNKDFNIKLSVCEEKKQCTNVQIQSIVTVDEHTVDSMQHSLLVLIDLRELGYPYEFEFQSKTIKQGFKFQYSLDSNIISNNNMKYQIVANILPTSSNIQIKLPNREILLETQQQFPEPWKLFGHYENSAAFYFDKINKPNDVTRFIASADVSGVERVALNAKAQLKFEHPSMRPLTISGKIDANREIHIADAEVVFDIFRVPEQQIIIKSHTQNTEIGRGFNITTNQELRSTGLGLHYDFNGHTALNTELQEFSAGVDLHSATSDLKASAYVFGNKDRIEVLVHGLNEQIIQMVGEFNRQKYVSKFQTKLQIYGTTPVEVVTELQPTMAKWSVKRQGLLDATGEIKLGKEIKMNIDGAGKNVFNGRIALDAVKFLQTTYQSNEEDVKEFLNTAENEIKKDTDMAKEKIQARFQKLREAIGKQVQLSKDSTPDFSQLKANYQNNVNEIVKELENDPSLKPIAEAYHKLYTKFAKIAGDIAKIVADFYENAHKSFVALFTKFDSIFKDTVLPSWEEFVLAATKIIGNMRVEYVKLITKVFKHVVSVLEEYGPALKNYGKAINESLKPFNDAVQELLKISAHAIEEFLNELKEYFAKLPTFDALRDEFKTKMEKLKIVEKALEFLNNLFDQLHILPQTPETVEFLTKAHEYIQAKLKEQPVQDEKLIGELFNLFVKAVRSVWTLVLNTSAIDANGSSISASSLSTLLSTTLPASVDIFSKLPALLSFRFSVLNFFINENWENVFSKDHLKSWIFFNDFKLRGHIADGHHIITFDGQHISFPGSCKYILAQDSVDNNFTVVAQLNNGKLKSIILTDRDENVIETTDAGVLKLNGQNVEFPQHHTGSIHAWRKFYTIWMTTEYGVDVMCTSDLKVCHIDVNGFYTSKTRGLLGNGNAEPNDDFVQIDGKLASDYAVFGNGYGIGKCNPVTYDVNNVNIKRTDICNEIFGLESPLAVGYLFMDVTPYRAACDNAVTASAGKDEESVACNVAMAYGSALKMRHKLAILPPRCLKCAGTAGQRDLGQEFTVKIPNNKADVVFVVDMGVSPAVLSQMVAPAIIEVRETLKARGLTDIQIGVIAYNESQRYPALLTSDNGKLNYQGNLAEVQLNGPKNFCDNCDSQVVHDKKVLDIYEMIENFVKSIVPQSDEIAFRVALNYPFRAGAAKSIIGVRSNTLEYGNLLKFIRAHITGAVTHFDAALLHLIGPVKDMSIEGVPTEKLVGFNSRLVATLDGKDAKKRQKLQFANDMGIDFVLNNGGWVFATQNFDSLKSQEQKKALNQVTNSIADSMFKTEILSDCKCMPVHGLHAQHQCVIKSSTFVPNKKVKSA